MAEDKTQAVPVVQIGEILVEAVYDNEKVTSLISGVAIQTLRNNRAKGKGIPYHKKSKSVKYFRPDVYRFMQNRRIATEDSK